MSPITLIPRPLRDLALGPLEIYFKTGKDPKVNSQYGTGGYRPEERLAQAVLHVALAALGYLVVFNMGGSSAIAATMGSVISFPAVAIVGGSWLLYNAGASAVAALASGSFGTLFTALISLWAGYGLLEYHDAVPFGVAEHVISKITEKVKQPLAQSFAS